MFWPTFLCFSLSSHWFQDRPGPVRRPVDSARPRSCAQRQVAGAAASTLKDNATSRACIGSRLVVSVSKATSSAASRSFTQRAEIRFFEERLVARSSESARNGRGTGRRGGAVFACRFLGPAFESETGDQFGRCFLVRGPSFSLFQPQTGKSRSHFTASKPLSFWEPVERLFADSRPRPRRSHRHAHHPLERPVLLEPLRRPFSDRPVDTRHVIYCVADKRPDNRGMRSGERRISLSLPRVEALVSTFRVDERHAVADQLREVLVAGGNHAAQARASRPRARACR